MNAAQRILVILGLLGLMIMGLFPPWTSRLGPPSFYVESDLGYRFLFAPPEGLGVGVNVYRLLIQACILVAAIGILFVLACKLPSTTLEKESRRPPGD